MKKGVLLILLLLFGSAFAGTDVIDNELYFVISNAEGYNTTAMLPGSADISANEEITLAFDIQFVGSSHTGQMLRGIQAHLLYNYLDWEVVSVVADNSYWTTSQVNYPTGSPEPTCDDGCLYLEITGEDVDPPTDLTTVAFVTFRSLCQAASSSSGIAIDGNMINQAITTSEFFTAIPNDFEMLIVKPYPLWFHIDSYDDAVGVMTDTVPVAIQFAQGGNKFKLNSATLEIMFDETRLSYIDVWFNPDYFDVGHGSSVDDLTSALTLNLKDLSDGIINPPNYGNEVLCSLYLVILHVENGDNDNLALTFNSANCTQKVFTDFDDDGIFDDCPDLNTSLIRTLQSGDIYIPAYTATLKVEPATEYYSKGDMFLGFKTSIQNNFYAGEWFSMGSGEIKVGFEIPDFLTYYDTDYIVDFIQFVGSGCEHNGTKVSKADDVYTSNWENKVKSPDDFTELFTLDYFFNDAEFVPDYNNREVTTSFIGSFWCGSGDHYNTKIVDFTNSVDIYIDYGIDTVNVPVEVNMGQFFAPFSSSTTTTIYQDLNIEATFDIGDFEVFVEVVDFDGRILSFIPEFDLDVDWEWVGTDYKKIRVFYNGTDFPDVVGEPRKIGRTKYRNYCNAAKTTGSLPGDGDEGYYVTVSVDFTDGFITDNATNYHFVDFNPSNVRGFCNTGVISDPIIRDGITKDNVFGLPTEFALHPNRPNPFNPTTIIAYDLPEPVMVTLEVINIAGQKVATLVDQFMESGRHETTWNGQSDYGTRVASGIYFYTIRAGEFSATKRMVLMK